jgi:DNA methylase
LTPRLIPVAGCNPLGRGTRKHPPAQVRKLAASLDRFGFVLPILIDPRGRVVAGWGLVLAARHLGLNEVPAISLTDLSETDLRMLRLALNRIADDCAWDRQALALEFAEILELAPQVEPEISGFEMSEIEVLLDGNGPDQEYELPPIDAEATAVTQRGDLWLLGEHSLLCGDVLDAESYACVMGTDKAQMMFAVPPENLRIDDHGSDFGAVSDFALASGELASSELQTFLRTALGHATRHSINGAIHYVCTNWRHQRELMKAGDEIYSELLNLCVWTKSNAGKGSLYRPQHEFVFVFKVGEGVNIIPLGRHGRHRSDVWDYGSDNSLNGSAGSNFATAVKPVAMIADAMRDCSNRGGVVIDPFGGVGTTLIAAEQTGRRARVIELNPILVDASIERWQRLTGGTALHADTGRPFARTANVSAGGQVHDKG